METPHVTDIKKIFRGVGKNIGEASPALAWRAMLWSFSLSSLVSIYIAYAAYEWANTPSEIKEVPDRGITVSSEEIKVVVDIYGNRKSEYERLMGGAAVPTPIFYRGEGTQATTTPQVSDSVPPLPEDLPPTLVN